MDPPFPAALLAVKSVPRGFSQRKVLATAFDEEELLISLETTGRLAARRLRGTTHHQGSVLSLPASSRAALAVLTEEVVDRHGVAG